MNSNNNASVTEITSRKATDRLTGAMQPMPAVGYSPSTHGADPGSAAQSLYPQSYVSPYDGGSSLANPYNRDGVFPNPTSSSSSLPFGGINDIAPTLFGSGMLGSHPYHPSAHPLHTIPRTNPGLLNYGQTGIQPPTQPPLFPSPSYGGFSNPLPMHLPPSQSMADRSNLLFNPHMISRFPGLHHRGSSPLSGYGMGSDASLRPPFTSLLSGPPDRKGLVSSPATNISNGAEMDPRSEMNNSRKKRKACGHCGPCQRKENCGSCMNCINRAKGKQICIHRKCEILKKKPGTTPYIPTPEPPSKQEKRKDVDEFVPNESKRSKTDDSVSADLPQGLVHPTLHPNFAEFGDISHGPSQSISRNQPRVTDNPLPSANPANQRQGNPPFYSGDQGPPQQTPYHQTGYPSSEQTPRTEPSGPTTGPPNEESDFINQALQAIESNISANQPSAGPSSNNSLNDTAGSGNIGAPLHNQGPPSGQPLQQLQSPQQRRVSQHDSAYWGQNVLEKPATSLNPEQPPLPGRPPPPTGPGPGSGSAESQALPDQLLNNLRKFNSSAPFHGQSSPIKDTTKVSQYNNNNLNPQNQKGYATPANHSQHSLPADSSKPVAQQPSFDPHSRPFSGNHSSENPTSTHQQPQRPLNEATMFQREGSQYPNDAMSAETNVRMMPSGSFSAPNGGFPPNNPSFPPPNSADPNRTYGRPEYPGAVDYNPAGGEQQFPPPFHPGAAPNTQGNFNHKPPQSYQFQQPTSKASYPQQQPSQYGATYNNQQPQFDQFNDQQRFPRHQQTRQQSGDMTSNMNHPIPNGNNWNFRMSAGPIQQQSSHEGTTPNIGNQTDQRIQQPPPSYTNAGNRRVSRNTSSECFPTSRHLSDQSNSNGSTNRSPMVQSSPAGQGGVTHSPFAGSAGSSLRSPVSALITGSPASQYQNPATSSPSVATMPHLSTSPNVVANPSAENSSMLGNVQQTYRPWHEHQQTAAGPPRTISSVDPTKPDSLSSASSTTNHFLARPGSSLDSRPHQPGAINGLPYNRANVADRRTSLEGRYVGSASFAAARLSVPDSPQASNGNKLGHHHLNHHHHPHQTAAYESSDKAFAETMNSVLYGKPPQGFAAHKGHADIGQKAASSPADVQSTISPGESGYDSAELSSVLSDNSHHHHHNPLPAPGQPRDVESLSVEGVLLAHADRSNPNEQPKNLYAASVGSETQRMLEFSADRSSASGAIVVPTSKEEKPRQDSSSLPAEVVLPAVQPTADATSLSSLLHTQLPLLSIASTSYVATPVMPSNVTQVTAKPRSHSLDLSSQSSENKVKDIPKVTLRRYSYQGPTTDRILLTKPNNPLPRPRFPLNTPTPYFPPTFRPHQHVKCNILDTPPQTPLSLHPRKSSSESIPCSGNGLTLPTPPHHPEDFPKLHPTPVVNTDDLRGRVVTTKGANNTTVRKSVFPPCSCLPDSDGTDDDAPYYTHLGAASSVEGIRKLFEKRCGYTGKALRIEKVQYTGKEGKTAHGCPIAKWILRRSGVDEKVLVVCRKRPKHHCPTAVVAIIIMLWEGVDRPTADYVYSKFVELVPTNGEATERRCATNEERTCACQGFDDSLGGASFSFGCSWSMFYNGCKYARSVKPNKFKLNGTKNGEAEELVTKICQNLASDMSVKYRMAAPDAHMNQTENEAKGSECRLGLNPPEVGRPFSGVTLCMDFCAHSHKDQNNMDNGSTVVLTLTKPEIRDVGKKPTDEQLHVLPLYKLDLSNEQETYDGVAEKIESGAIEILSSFPRQIRLRDKPLGTCKQRKDKKRRGDLYTTPPKKKRGRSPKRSHSMEDLASAANQQMVQIQRMESTWYNQHQHQMQQHHNSPMFSPYSKPNQMNPQMDPIASPPPRWPYRRHPSFSPSPSVDHNLPSIGSIFSPGGTQIQTPKTTFPPCGFTPPLTPRQAPSPMPFQFGRRMSTTSPCISQTPPHASPLPSMGSMPNHPGTGQFLTHPVKREPCNDESYPDPKINLKSYAANSPAHGVHFQTQHPQVKKEESTFYSDARESFGDGEVGGVAIAPMHGSVLIECAKRELHATTALLKPDRFNPSRISMVFYQHKNMNYRNHGAAEYEEKEAQRTLKKAAKLAEEKRNEEILQQQQQTKLLQQTLQQQHMQPHVHVQRLSNQQHRHMSPHQQNLVSPRFSSTPTSNEWPRQPHTAVQTPTLNLPNQQHGSNAQPYGYGFSPSGHMRHTSSSYNAPPSVQRGISGSYSIESRLPTGWSQPPQKHHQQYVYHQQTYPQYARHPALTSQPTHHTEASNPYVHQSHYAPMRYAVAGQNYMGNYHYQPHSTPHNPQTPQYTPQGQYTHTMTPRGPLT